MGARGWIIVSITHHLVVERLHFKLNLLIKILKVKDSFCRNALRCKLALKGLFLSIHPFHVKYHYLTRRFSFLSRCQTNPSMWTIGIHQPVIP